MTEIHLPESDEVGETVHAVVDVAQLVEQVRQAQVQGADVEPRDGALGVVQDLDLLQDQPILLVTKVVAGEDSVGRVDEPADEAVEGEPGPQVPLHTLLLPAAIFLP